VASPVRRLQIVKLSLTVVLLNSGEFTDKVERSTIIDFERFYVLLGAQKYNLKMKHVSIFDLNRSFEMPLRLTADTTKSCFPRSSLR
jgi:hypothetical protein